MPFSASFNVGAVRQKSFGRTGGMTARKGITVIDLLTAQEVAKALKVNYRKVLDMIALGELQAYRIGRVFRVSKDELDRYLRNVKLDSHRGYRR